VFTPDETAVCNRLIGWALGEDLGTAGDLTSQALLPPDLRGRAVFVARSAGVLAGLPAASLVLAAVDPQLTLEPLKQDGDRLGANDRIAIAEGPMRSLLTAERTALNFLQHLSGIATLTRRYVDAVAGLPVRILDTRKTIPGWRLLAKYAVRQGGGYNHRTGLHDGILVKDNHLAALSSIADCGLRIADCETASPRNEAPSGSPLQSAIRNPQSAIEWAVRLARQWHGRVAFVEIEVESLEQLDVALRAQPNMVLLDNMPPDTMREAVRRRNAVAPGVLLEASGGVDLTTVRGIAETGVDRISVGALTHSAPALDIALDYLR
jgi:nicotinate-nucleotide pyrophosphorylase (carboxylating)